MVWNNLWRLNLPGPQTNLQVQKAGDGFLIEKEIELSAALEDDVFEVTGLVALKIVGVCTERVTTHGDSVSLGTSDSTTAIIAATTGANLHAANVDALWVDNAPQTNSEIKEAFDADMFVVNNEDIVVTSTANVDGGKIKFYCWWKPISADGNVAPA